MKAWSPQAPSPLSSQILRARLANGKALSGEKDRARRENLQTQTQEVLPKRRPRPRDGKLQPCTHTAFKCTNTQGHQTSEGNLHAEQTQRPKQAGERKLEKMGLMQEK